MDDMGLDAKKPVFLSEQHLCYTLYGKYYDSTCCKLYRIQGQCLLISSLPGKALRMFADIARLAERFNMRTQS